MSVIEYVNSRRISLSEEELEALRSLEVDCIMTDWKCILELKPLGNSLSEEELEALRLLEADCIMTDWRFVLELKPLSNSWRARRNYLYIDLINSNLERYLIDQINDQPVRYTLTRGFMEDGFFKGSMIECIEYFRKHVLLKKN